jgi:hypothetical protein
MVAGVTAVDDHILHVQAAKAQRHETVLVQDGAMALVDHILHQQLPIGRVPHVSIVDFRAEEAAEVHQHLMEGAQMIPQLSALSSRLMNTNLPAVSIV